MIVSIESNINSGLARWNSPSTVDPTSAEAWWQRWCKPVDERRARIEMRRTHLIESCSNGSSGAPFSKLPVLINAPLLAPLLSINDINQVTKLRTIFLWTIFTFLCITIISILGSIPHIDPSIGWFLSIVVLHDSYKFIRNIISSQTQRWRPSADLIETHHSSIGSFTIDFRLARHGVLQLLLKYERLGLFAFDPRNPWWIDLISFFRSDIYFHRTRISREESWNLSRELGRESLTAAKWFAQFSVDVIDIDQY